MILILVLVVAGAVIALGGFGLASLGTEGGDLPVDARSTVGRTGEACAITVVNPGTAPAVIGVAVRRAKIWDREPFTQRIVIRPPRRRERHRSDRGAVDLLGVVEPGAEARWSRPAPAGTTRVRIVIGQSGARLRIHDHRVGPLASPHGLYPSGSRAAR